ncbi:long-chain-fatty-acid--CoA ligase 5 [Caerostris extrusa]|uniref:long-chain-fatty-acid--CoA ligase n=1 Tax=Caerostris extrusa TaxID=172846 RepID=A0AAV4SVX6_CAEEX|nr:long-chain-fatty-acid--CoA ligase 5 [Caerostris extrusa]
MLKDSAVRKEDLEISYLPLAHIFEQIVQTLMLVNGASIGFFGGDLTKLAEDMKVLQPTVFPAVPRTLNKLYDKAQALIRSKLKSLPMMELLKDDYFKNISHLKIEWLFLQLVTEFYGQTECSGPCSLVVLDSYYVGNVGTPVSCCMVKTGRRSRDGLYGQEL